MSKENNPLWFSFPGQENQEMADKISQNAKKRILEGSYSENDIKFFDNYKLPLLSNSLELSDERLEKLRTLAKNWEIKLAPPKITSHRPFIGPVIVFAKKILFRIIGVLLKDLISEQRKFNAQVVEYLALKK